MRVNKRAGYVAARHYERMLIRQDVDVVKIKIKELILFLIRLIA